MCCGELRQGRGFGRWCRGFLGDDDDFVGGRRRGRLTKGDAIIPGKYHLIDLERGSFWILLMKGSDKVLTKRLTLRRGFGGNGEVWRSHSSVDESLSVYKIMPGRTSIRV